MSFTEWYESINKEKWIEEHAWLGRITSFQMERYESYCKEKGIEPVWDG